jgi:hypothetical protein
LFLSGRCHALTYCLQMVVCVLHSPLVAMSAKCTVEGCGKWSFQGGLCRGHMITPQAAATSGQPPPSAAPAPVADPAGAASLGRYAAPGKHVVSAAPQPAAPTSALKRLAHNPPPTAPQGLHLRQRSRSRRRVAP